MIRSKLAILRHRGYAGFYRELSIKIRAGRLQSFSLATALFAGKSGIEIGGPSSLFSIDSPLPIYPILGHLDICNYSRHTIWDGQNLGTGTNPPINLRSAGKHYIAEATDLHQISDTTYDFVLSSHMLEHSANPLKAIIEWIRVLKYEGVLLLVVPHKDATFDHRRPVTHFEHLVADFNSNMAEDDLSHLPEILELHDLAMDPAAGSFDDFKKRSLQNFKNRALHQHVFDTNLAVKVVDWAGLGILAVEPARPNHIVIIAKKELRRSKNDRYLNVRAGFHKWSPFATDRNYSQ
jgi:SAM-dependent methyltransferase